MNRSRRSMTLLLALALAASVSPARAAETAYLIVTGPGSTQAGYASPVFVVTKGTPLLYVNADITTHNVVSDDVRTADRPASHCATYPCPLFTSGPEIGIGDQREVRGIADLDTGVYGFHCAPHPWMEAFLVVVDA